MTIYWKIIVVILVLAQTSIGTFLGWRVLRLMKRVNQIQEDRNKLIEERNKLRLREMESLGNLSETERQIIIAALNMPEYGKEIQDPRTGFQVRKVYRDLVEKIKDSLKK